VKNLCFSQSAGNRNFSSSSETTRVTSEEKEFYNWFGGLIDGDGCFLVSKEGYCSCEITLHEKELLALLKVKKYVGGSLGYRVGAKAVRLRLHNEKVVKPLLYAINGRILTAKRQKQFVKVCNKLEIPILQPIIRPDLKNAWLSGFIDAEGSFNIKDSYQPVFTLGQKDSSILNEINGTGLGYVVYDKSWNGWVWAVTSVEELHLLLDYFAYFPLKTPKSIEARFFKKFLLYKSRKYHSDPVHLKKVKSLILAHFRRKKI